MGGTGKERLRAQAGSAANVGHSAEPGPALVGTRLEALRQALMQASEPLHAVLDPTGHQLVDEAAQVLEARACRVAILGQIGSGKTSLATAIAQRPGLLPTGSGASSPTVTHLHLRQAHNGGGTCAVQFFDAGDWDSLADGEPLLRALTERLVPGFEPALLRQHLTAARVRAQTRLGPELAALLGQTLQLDTVTIDRLRPYVARPDIAGPYVAGNEVVAEPAATWGRYADVTKAIHLALDSGAFAFPMTLMDTPGASDPFMIGGEIARRCLEQADIHVLVVSAAQPLSAGDLALLRVMKELHKDRIIVFLNRIDELPEIAAQSEIALDNLRRRLAVELPGMEVRVIAGSARWGAHAMLDGGTNRLDTALDPRALAYLQDSGLIQRKDLVRPAQEHPQRRVMLQRALLTASGLPQILGALDELLTGSHSAHVIRSAALTFTELARRAHEASEHEAKLLALTNGEAIDSAERTRREIARLDGELANLHQMADVIAQTGPDLERRMRDILAGELSALRDALAYAVAEFAREEGESLLGTLLNGRPPSVWCCDQLHLQRTVSAIFVERFELGEARLHGMRQMVLPELERMLATLAPASNDAGRRAFPGGAPSVPSAPSTASEMRALTLDLETPWWRAAWKARLPPQQRAEMFRLMVVDAFEPILEKLMRSAKQAMEGYVSATTQWVGELSRGIIEALGRRRETLQSSLQALRARTDGSADPAAAILHRDRLEALDRRLALTGSLVRQLEAINQDISRVLD